MRGKLLLIAVLLAMGMSLFTGCATTNSFQDERPWDMKTDYEKPMTGLSLFGTNGPHVNY